MIKLLIVFLLMLGFVVLVYVQEVFVFKFDIVVVQIEGDDVVEEEDDDNVEFEVVEEVVYDVKGKFDYGFLGVFVWDNCIVIVLLMLGLGKLVVMVEYMLKLGGYYCMDIIVDGMGEMVLLGGDFFCVIWINEIVINDIEIWLMGVYSFEFDDVGMVMISFVVMVLGCYILLIFGLLGDMQWVVFNIQ